jgi:hypothetical protein
VGLKFKFVLRSAAGIVGNWQIFFSTLWPVTASIRCGPFVTLAYMMGSLNQFILCASDAECVLLADAQGCPDRFPVLECFRDRDCFHAFARIAALEASGIKFVAAINAPLNTNAATL